MRTSLIIFFIIVFFTNIINAQEKKNNYIKFKNTIYASVGMLAIIPAGGIDYERIVSEKNKVYFATNISAKYWENSWSKEEGYLFTLSGKIITGPARKFHAEFDLGLSSILETDMSFRIYPNIFIGSRFQHSQKRFLFKSGIGFPNLFHLSIGWSF